MHSKRNTHPINHTCSEPKPTRRPLLLLALSTLGLSACGFSLRRSVLPTWYASKALRAEFAPGSLLGTQFRQAYLASGGKLATPDSKPDLILRVLAEEKKRVPLSTTIGGLVREYRLDLRLSVELLDAQGQVIMPPSTFKEERLLSFNESAALAKEYETTQSYREMGQALVQTLLHRLSAVSL